jgi:hypothetical protein
MNVFSRFEYHVLGFASICDLVSDSSSYYDMGVMECIFGGPDVLCRRYFSWE